MRASTLNDVLGLLGAQKVLHLDDQRFEGDSDHARVDARRGEVVNDVHVAFLNRWPEPLPPLEAQQPMEGSVPAAEGCLGLHKTYPIFREEGGTLVLRSSRGEAQLVAQHGDDVVRLGQLRQQHHPRRSLAPLHIWEDGEHGRDAGLLTTAYLVFILPPPARRWEHAEQVHALHRLRRQERRWAEARFDRCRVELRHLHRRLELCESHPVGARHTRALGPPVDAACGRSGWLACHLRRCVGG